MKKISCAAVVVAFAVASLACNKSDRESTNNMPSSNHEPAPELNAAAYLGKVDLAGAQAIFAERCAACHGAEGKGNGPAAAALNPKPRNYGDKAWQSGVTDEQLRKTIHLGGAAVGKSPLMPGSPDLDDKPEVIEGLVKLVRKFGS